MIIMIYKLREQTLICDITVHLNPGSHIIYVKWLKQWLDVINVYILEHDIKYIKPTMLNANWLEAFLAKTPSTQLHYNTMSYYLDIRHTDLIYNFIVWVKC